MYFFTQMQYRELSNTGLLVSELCLGAMTFGGKDGIWGMIGNLDQKEVDELVGASIDSGINFFDTANYTRLENQKSSWEKHSPVADEM